MPSETVYTYDAERGWSLFLGDAYEGGTAWERPSSATLGTAALTARVLRDVPVDGRTEQVIAETTVATERSYLVAFAGETLANFRRRQSLAVYVNLVAPIVDAYVDSVTGRVTRELGTMEPALGNLDGDGQSWGELVECAVRQAALDGVTAVVIDAPEENPAANRAEELAQGVGLRATAVPLAAWAWVCVDARGAVTEFAYADSALVDPAAASEETVHLWVWSRAGWAVYEQRVGASTSVEYGKLRKGVQGAEPLRRGDLHPRLGGKLPVVFCYNRRVRRTRAPRGTSLAAGPATIGRQVYQLLSQIEDIQRRAPSFLAIPTAAKGGLEPETQIKVGPDSSLPVPEGGTPAWVAHPTAPMMDLRAHVVFLVALAYRISGLEVQADQSAQVQSGEALRVRSRDFEARAGKLAKDARAFELRALAMCALYLGAQDRATVTYPQRFVLADTAELLNAAITVLDKLGSQLGTEGAIEAMRQALAAALAIDDAMLTKILDEIRVKLSQERAPTVELNSFNTPWAAGNEVRATMGLGAVPGGEVIPALEEQKRRAQNPATSPNPATPPNPAVPPEAP